MAGYRQMKYLNQLEKRRRSQYHAERVRETYVPSPEEDKMARVAEKAMAERDRPGVLEYNDLMESGAMAERKETPR